MADNRKNGAANAAAVWCANNLLNMEVCSAKQKNYFKNALAAKIRQVLNFSPDSEGCCVLQISEKCKNNEQFDYEPNEILNSVLKQVGFTGNALCKSNLTVRIYPGEVWIDFSCQNNNSAENSSRCIYKTCT